MVWRPLTPDTVLSPNSILGPLGWWSAEGDVARGEGFALDAEADLTSLDVDGSVGVLDADSEL